MDDNRAGWYETVEMLTFATWRQFEIGQHCHPKWAVNVPFEVIEQIPAIVAGSVLIFPDIPILSDCATQRSSGHTIVVCLCRRG
jgi:hypothetical protein